MIQFPAALRLRTGSNAAVSFEIPIKLRDTFWRTIESAKTDYWCVRITRPRQPRTTGKDSQNHAGNGFCQQIAVATGNSFQAVKQYTKTEAIGRGYSFETLPNGAVMPISEANASTLDAYHWIKAIKQLADELGIKLMEDDGE